ncbi:hypothetical protein [Chitiniphilus eburneus]|uniref:Uncharacterized protein n=1 Tax=Chitiniphilus eburneus TaxID=2571148 RepID=A0A4U0PFV5_9NEIS|nr:hypothetical protein [Chitiniphilus eburneus]TJZ66816.1 hypothetical protein FAZ21_16660 [Chitiniphilus eburneus]
MAVHTDWEAIERDYRAGIKTLRQIAEEHGITHGTVTRRAGRDGWTRDLSAKIAARAEALVSAQAVPGAAEESGIAEREIVEANANAIVAVRLAHRRDIGRSRELVSRLFAELEPLCGADTVALLAQLGEMMRAPDERDRDPLNDLYHKIISLPERIKTMKVLSDLLAKVVDMERQAFNLDANAIEEEGGTTLTDAQRASRIATLLDKARRQDA